ncbi:hypothetical protein F4780DRAFT_526900 [Xylariomycetidae sp. FL0641]|nr:hypothetical protein F4780DRAFT_526900 [Xylariomycetidae sp. FL0641]
MEPHRLPRRSASHGTLRSTHSTHSRLGVGPSPSRPFHKPLRSVNENSALLPSPGALESMLKTTTETGDIGIFTIKPVPPSPQRCGSFSDFGSQLRPPRLSVDEQYRHNQASMLRSHRDTTSEIISMYGSESQRSGMSTLSPTSTIDAGLRSYSMTTCGSRHLSHHRSTTTLQSQTSGSGLQRPRSPFPYPTRLKRPGVRPASPALTENGRVDYSRMVEIDRISLRTVHGHFKPAYPQMQRRHPPLSLRAEANQSTPSLPPGPPPNFHGPPPPSIRTHSAASMASWSAPLRDRHDSGTSRTSSLTSIVNMYNRPAALRLPPSGLSVPPPRYYDYTEDFESKQPRVTTPVQPVAPVPTRFSTYNRPQVLQDSDDHLAAVFGEGDSAFLDVDSQHDEATPARSMPRDLPTRAESRSSLTDRPSSRSRPGSVRSQNCGKTTESAAVSRKNTRTSDIDLLPSQVGRESIDTFNPNLDLESRDPPTYDYTTYRAAATPKTKTNSPQRQVQVLGGRTPTIRSEQGVILRDDNQDDCVSKEAKDTGSEGEEVLPIETMVHESPGRRSYSELVKDATGLANQSKPRFDCGRRFVSANPEGLQRGLRHRNAGLPSTNMQREVNHSAHSDPSQPKAVNEIDGDGEDNPLQSQFRELSKAVQKHTFRRHRRSPAALKISTAGLPRGDHRDLQHITPSCSTAPLISPKPISPARQLKVKNSIPQLMKALPPLPGDLDYPLPPTPATTADEDDFAEILAPYSFSQPHTLRIPHKIASTRDDARMKDNRPPPDLQKNLPKLKLKVKASRSTANSSSTDYKAQSTDTDILSSKLTPDTEVESTVGAKCVRPRDRLKLRSSRSARTDTPPPATVRRNPDAQVSDFVAGLTRQPTEDLFTVSAGLGSSLRQMGKKLSYPRRERSPAVGTGGTSIANLPSQRPEDQRASPSKIPLAPTHTGTTQTETEPEVRKPHGLLKHLSNIRAMLAPSSDHAAGAAGTIAKPSAFTADQVGYQDGYNMPNLHVFDKQVVTDDGFSTSESARAPFGRRIRAKLTKWVKGAKTAARKCTSKEHHVA